MTEFATPPPTIADHGLIGNCRTAALISSRGAINWLCAPHFDSPFLFARLLDSDRGGSWELHPQASFRSQHAYLDDTNVLVTTFTTDSGRARCLDLMDVHTADGSTRLCPGAVIRIVEGLEGLVDMVSTCAPRPANATVLPDIAVQGTTATFGAFSVHAPVPWEAMPEDHAVRASFTVHAGVRVAFLLRGPGMDTTDDPWTALDRTVAFWSHWAGRCTYRGEYRSAVVRSVLTLKLLHDNDTGALVAAPTTSLPEEIGGVRNWDYRFCWIRDASFTFHALQAAGYMDEDEAFFQWIVRTVKVDGPDLRILYPISPDGQVEERTLDHLQGYLGSRPVRIGNAAAVQLQLDVFGEVMSALEFAVVEGGYDVRRIWPTVRALVDWVADHWSLPESGIWEVRGGLRHFVHGKLMCWVALDRGERLAERTGLERGRRDWAAQRDRLRAEILTKGWSDRLGAFKQSYEDERLDAANLMLPLVGFLPGDDPRVIATIDAILARLVNNGLCYRYLDAPDGIAGGEGTFVLCTFWLIQALLLAGRRTEARDLFDALLARATALGLFAEELDPTTGEHLGNFPQAFSHIGLVHTAIQLAR